MQQACYVGLKRIPCIFIVGEERTLDLACQDEIRFSLGIFTPLEKLEIFIIKVIVIIADMMIFLAEEQILFLQYVSLAEQLQDI